MPPRSEFRLSDQDRRTLLALARQAISHVVFHRDFPDLPSPSGRLAEPGSAFVSVRCNGKLRGCVGRTFSDIAWRRPLRSVPLVLRYKTRASCP